jgi:SAM-dependent methyltransferase
MCPSDAGGPRASVPTEWPIAFFDDDYLRIYAPVLTPALTAEEVAFIEARLALAPGASVLDLACGAGRHAVAMAARGYAVTGVDFNAHYLDLAREAAARAGVAVDWRQGDMRRLDFAGRFDAVYSYFTSFGYFSDEENENVLAGVARALKPGGRFLLDVVNRDWMLTHPQQRTWSQREDGALLMEELRLDVVSSRVTSRQTLIDAGGGARVNKEYDLRAYTCAELTALMRRHGLVVGCVLGSAAGEGYSTESRRLILLAVRGS